MKYLVVTLLLSSSLINSKAQACPPFSLEFLKSIYSTNVRPADTSLPEDIDKRKLPEDIDKRRALTSYDHLSLQNNGENLIWYNEQYGMGLKEFLVACESDLFSEIEIQGRKRYLGNSLIELSQMPLGSIKSLRLGIFNENDLKDDALSEHVRFLESTFSRYPELKINLSRRYADEVVHSFIIPSIYDSTSRSPADLDRDDNNSS